MDTSVQIQEPTTSLSQAQPIVVVGAGPAGFRFCEEFFARETKVPVVLVGNEPYQPYDRVRLSVLLSGGASQSDLQFPLDRLMAQEMFTYREGNVTSINADDSSITFSDGSELSFQKLVIATGSRAHVPNIAGVDLDGVYTFRNMRDTERLKARGARSHRLVVVGGGLLGIEAAKAMSKGHTQVTLVQQAGRLMNRQLDEEAAKLLETHVSESGIDVILNSGVRVIEGQGGRVEAVKLRDGTEVACDTVLIAAGIRPNLELARSAWLKVGKGIRVDNQLTTSNQNIFAIGECAEHDGQVYGLVAPGLEQASIAASVISQQHGQYLGSMSVSRLKVMDQTVFSMGDLSLEEDNKHPQTRVYTWRNTSSGTYRKLIINRGQLIGAIAVGDWDEIPRIQELITHKRKLHLLQALRFSLSGKVWAGDTAQNPNSWPEDAIICNCNQVSRGQLSDYFAGVATPEVVQIAERAGTTCGTCKPLLAQMSAKPLEKEPLSIPALLVSFFAVLLAIFWWVSSPMTVSDSVQTPGLLEPIWNDGFFKQVTGFSLLGLTAIGLLMSLRKRIKLFSWGGFAGWRLVHIALSVLSLVVLVAHTGLNMGENLNFWLLTNFLLLALLGGIVGAVIAQQHRLGLNAGAKVRQWSFWGHLLLSWPLPALLSFHVLSVYYF